MTPLAGLLALLVLLLSGCGIPAGENIAYVPPDAPVISLPAAGFDTVGVPVSYAAVSTGGPITKYSILPPLPKGMTLNTATGVLGGTPTAGCPPTLHILTATGPGGSDTAQLVLRIAYRPFTVSYPVAAVADTVDDSLAYAAIPDTVPFGPIASYSVSPALPAGVHLDTLTGLISGRPTVAWPSTKHVVTARGPGGDTDTGSVTLRIVHRPPAISYASPVVDTQYREVSHPVISTGGRVTVFRISPALPEGLNFDTLTGQIWGSPLAEIPETEYTVIATGPAGLDTASLALGVVEDPSLPPNATGVSLSLNLGFASGIPLSRLVLTFTSSDPLDSTIRDTVLAEEEGFAGNPGAAQTFAKLYSLKPLRTWYIDVKTLDANDSVIHAGADTAASLLVGQVQVASLTLASRFVAYTAQFVLPTNADNFITDYNVPLQFNRFVFVIAGDTLRDTIAPGSGVFPATGTRTFGSRYVPADKVGQLELLLFGTAAGWNPALPLLKGLVWLGGAAYVPGTIVYSPPLQYTGPGSVYDPDPPLLKRPVE